MNAQFDHRERVVSLDNLEAMCARHSSTCHRFAVVPRHSPRGNRLRVVYSNPDEYGNECPTVAVLPCYPQHESLAVVLDPVRYVGGRRDDESWQAFQVLWDCPQLWRGSDGQWRSELEILTQRFPSFAIRSHWEDSCTQVFKCNGEEFRERGNAETWALEQMRSLDRAERDAKR